MLAQRNAEIFIDGIEIDTGAAEQAKKNIEETSWGNRIRIFEGDAKNYAFSEKYDLIITNPPFFNNSLLGPAARKNGARHTVNLTCNDIIRITEICLNEGGYLAILLPDTEFNSFEEMAMLSNWQPFYKLSIKHRETSPAKRVAGLFKKETATNEVSETLVIMNADNSYTPAFRNLMAPFYLNL